MSNTYFADAIRFQKRYAAPTLTPTSASYTAAVAAWYGLMGEPWMKVRTEKAAVLAPHETDAATEPADREYYDAYELCGEHADSQHRCYAGMTAYRIALPDAAAGLSLVSVSAAVASDPYNRYGAHVAVSTSGDMSPSDLWSVCRDGAAYAGAVAPRTTSVDGTLWYGATATATVAPDGGLTLQKYLWVFVSLENYQRSRNGWLEGSAILVPRFTLTLSAPISGYSDNADIGGGYRDEAILTVCDGGIVFSPLPEERSKTREVAILTCPVPAALGSASALPFAPVLFSRLAAAGSSAGGGSVFPMSVYESVQTGLSCSVSRRKSGTSGPVIDTLNYCMSPLVATFALPDAFCPKSVRLINRGGAVSTAGADMRISVYWSAATEITLADLSAFFRIPDFHFGGQTLTAAEKTAVLVGSSDFPESLDNGESVLIHVPGITDRWGTLVIVPLIARITAEAIPEGAVVGLAGLEVVEDEVEGHGWVPKITLEM